MQDVKPNVSIVIATYNRSMILTNCLEALFDQSYPDNQYEIIVINDGSNDETESILKDFEKKAPCRFIWNTQDNHGRSYARNAGIAQSQGDLICFEDDDCIAEKDWVKNLIGGFTNDTIGAVGGKIVSYHTDTPIQQFSEDSGIVDQETFIKRNTLITGNAAYRKQVLTDIAGFDTHLVACEDLDISIKTQLLGYTLKYVPDAVVHHDHPATVKGLFSQQYRNGIGFVGLHRKYGQKYNLAYNTSISLGVITFILLRYPFTLVSALVLKKKKSFVLKPLYNVIYYGAFSLAIVRETLFGKEYRKNPIQSRIHSKGFMENKSISSLCPKIFEMIRKYR